MQGPGVTFDLSALSTSYGIRIRDMHNNSYDPLDPYSGGSCVYDYIFSVCSNVDLPSSPVTNSSMCATTTGANGTTSSLPSPAFQLVSALSTGCGPNCQRLAGPAVNGQFFTVFGRNPARGVSLYYPGGDTCRVVTSTATSVYPRSVVLDFVCYDGNGYVPQYNEIYEDVQCVYHAIIYTRFACPQQCNRASTAPFRMCSNQGICNYDTSLQSARCFCDRGWSGGACDQPGDKGLPAAPSFGGNIAGAFFGGLLCAAAAVLIGFAVRSYMTKVPFVETLKLSLPGMGGSSGGGAAYTAAPTSSYIPAEIPSDAGMGAAYAAPQPMFSGSTTAAYAPPEQYGDKPFGEGSLLA